MAQHTQHDLIRIAAEEDLSKFIKLIAPHRVHGAIHEKVIKWWTREGAKSHQLLLLPRDHLKSSLVAYRAAWCITKDPTVTIMYMSSTSNLAEKQLKFIKDILDSKTYRRYWPDMTHPDEAKRERWTNEEISVDHPLRKKEAVRDPTVFTAGLTSSRTGLHCKVAILDDMVSPENAYTTEGRDKVESQYGHLASIESTDAEEWVVGTRYFDKDLYGQMMAMEAEVMDEDGNISSSVPIYEVFSAVVEDRGDGTGEYLWPRQQRASDGKWFGFNQQILAKKKAQYLDRSRFNSQYYNDPNSSDDQSIERNKFQYYERKHVTQEHGKWMFKGNPLNVFAAMDFAFSRTSQADYTALAVIGIDSDRRVFILDLDRFKTNRISDYYDCVIKAHGKWNLRKLRAEITVAQEAIVEELKLRLQQDGYLLPVDCFRPDRTMGTKAERIDAILRPRYENQSIFHYQSGITTDLEEELIHIKPSHDDLKNALADAIEIATPPIKQQRVVDRPKVIYNTRFGGA